MAMAADQHRNRAADHEATREPEVADRRTRADLVREHSLSARERYGDLLDRLGQ